VRRWTVGTWLLLSLVCDAQEPDPVEPARVADEGAGEAPALVNGPLAEAVLTLLDPGRGRRLRLRLPPGQGERWQGQLTRSSETRAATDGGEAVVQKPLEAVAVVALERVETGRVVVVPTSFDLIGGDAREVGPLMLALDAVVGLELGVELSPQQVAHVQLPPMPPDLSEAAGLVLGDLVTGLQLLAVPLPEQAVGVGARWAYDQAVRQDGVVVEQHREVHLLRRQGTTVVLELSGSDTLRDGEAARVAVEALSGTSAGKVWMDLRSPLPKAAELRLATVVAARWTDEAQVEHRTEAEGVVELVWVTREAAP
jgi:hypothetical protein